ncbi:MAG TPA: hypothetical protein VE987_10915 [Polyangiaceae bacterium]|nr:hypothetical protein [Polyangiaceae bacterium]
MKRLAIASFLLVVSSVLGVGCSSAESVRDAGSNLGAGNGSADGGAASSSGGGSSSSSSGSTVVTGGGGGGGW